MKKETLKRLYIRLNGFRQRFKKDKYFFQRKGDLIRVAFKTPIGIYGFRDYMPANEMMVWLEGVMFGANAADYEPFEM